MPHSRLAPIVLFVYNRPWHTRQTLESLMSNELAGISQMIIYCDGPKDNATEEQRDKIIDVRRLVHEKKWCGQVEIIEFNYNKGLATSIIEGVTEIVNKFNKIIVLEDDLIVSEGFLDFMNRALDLYEKEKKVMHISGHSFPIFKRNYGTYFLRYVSPWGWATWSDRWKYLEKDALIIYNKLLQNQINWKDFNSGYGNEFRIQLLSNINNSQNTWDIKWHSSVYLNNGLTLFPRRSLVRNTGFDTEGTHTNIINRILVNQKIAVKNNLKFSKPVINSDALLRFRFFYLKNVFLKTIINKTLKFSYGRFQSICLGKAK